MTMGIWKLAAIAAVTMCGSAHAALFSLIADTDHSAWAFTGGGGSFTDGANPMFPQTLLVDDVNGPLPAIPFWTQLHANFEISHLDSVAADNGLFQHTYSITGDFSFVDMAGNPMLSGSIGGAILSALGGPLSWFPLATIRSDDALGTTTLQWHPDRILGYDIGPGVYRVDDIRFFLADISFRGEDLSLDPETLLPASTWVCESGFNGRNLAIPAPGATLVAGACGVLALARRRRPV